jgi:hypothetical protein
MHGPLGEMGLASSDFFGDPSCEWTLSNEKRREALSEQSFSQSLYQGRMHARRGKSAATAKTYSRSYRSPSPSHGLTYLSHRCLQVVLVK